MTDICEKLAFLTSSTEDIRIERDKHKSNNNNKQVSAKSYILFLASQSKVSFILINFVCEENDIVHAKQ